MLYVKTAAIKVAKLPATMSCGIISLKITQYVFAAAHPIVKPGIAAKLKRGRTVKASAMLICNMPKLTGESAYVENIVKAIYKNAINNAVKIFFLLKSLIVILLFNIN